jgi:ribosome-binding protein aMBF1 (putative translation factor)
MRKALSTKIIYYITPAQCRAARALLGITQSELAEAAGLGLSTVVDFEKERRRVSDQAVKAMHDALKGAGIAFNGGGTAVAFSPAKSSYVTILGKSHHTGLKGKTKGGLLSSAQIRAARALLRWSAQDLARESALGVNTIRRAEVAEESISLTVANELAIRRAFEAVGVVFIDENGGGPGVRLRERSKEKSRK